jgi:hypothetical protein
MTGMIRCMRSRVTPHFLSIKKTVSQTLLRRRRAASLRCSPRRVLTIHSSALLLARIFHTNHLRKPGSQMDAALSSKSSSGSVYTHSRRQTSSLALPHQPSQLPRYDQYEIFGLDSLLFIRLGEFATRFLIFSRSLLRRRRAASLRCSPRRVLTIHSSALLLARIFHTDHLRKPGRLMDAALSSKSSSGSVYTHSRRQTSSLPLPHQPSQLPRYDQYEIFGLDSLLFIRLSEFATWFLIFSRSLLRRRRAASLISNEMAITALFSF